MQYEFKQAVHLCGKDYPLGIHEVPEKHEAHPHFLKYVGVGFIVEADAAKLVSCETMEERSKKLLNKLIERRKPVAPKPVAQAKPCEPEQECKPVSEEKPCEEPPCEEAPCDEPAGAPKKKKR